MAEAVGIAHPLQLSGSINIAIAKALVGGLPSAGNPQKNTALSIVHSITPAGAMSADRTKHLAGSIEPEGVLPGAGLKISKRLVGYVTLQHNEWVSFSHPTWWIVATIANILDSMYSSVNEAILTFKTAMTALGLIRRTTGTAGNIWANDLRLWLSKREAQLGWVWRNSIVIYGTTITNPTLGDILKRGLRIHSRRGSGSGIIPDIQRLCNTQTVAVTNYSILSCGWMLGLTSPGFMPTGEEWNPADSLTFLGMENLLVVDTENKSARSSVEVKRAIRTDIVPINRILRVNLS